MKIRQKGYNYSILLFSFKRVFNDTFYLKREQYRRGKSVTGKGTGTVGQPVEALAYAALNWNLNGFLRYLPQ